MGLGLETCFLTDVLEHCKNLSNLALFEHFSSNRVGDPLGPQFVGACALKVETSVSQDPYVERSHDFVQEVATSPVPVLKTAISLELTPQSSCGARDQIC